MWKHIQRIIGCSVKLVFALSHIQINSTTLLRCPFPRPNWTNGEDKFGMRFRLQIYVLFVTVSGVPNHSINEMIDDS